MRYPSLDALRGLDILFIIGLDTVLRRLAGLMPEGELRHEIYRQMGHVAWEGLTLYDLIFPLFVLISGAAMYFSVSRGREIGRSRVATIARLWQRAAILIICGWLVNGPLLWRLSEMRYASVLGLIGISCALAGCAALFLRRLWQIGGSALLILLAVGIAQTMGGDMTPTGCLNARVDALLCPGVLHSGSYDPEGPLCILSATALCLLGYCAGAFLSVRKHSRLRISCAMGILGALLLLIGQSCGPVIKGIWTPSFTLSAAGIGYMLLAAFHLLCDSARGAVWCLPLRIVGVNALFIYLVTHVLPFADIVERIFGGGIRELLPPSIAPLAHALCYLALAWTLCYALWKKNIFIKA